MDDDSNNQDDEVELVDIANYILALLNSSDKIENEEDLFSDEFYISVISVLMADEEIKLKPGKTPDEKVKNLKELLNFFTNMLEIELPDIDSEAIILEHDRKNTKTLLELLFNLIQTILKAQLEQMGDEDLELDDNEGNHSNDYKLNLSEKKPKQKMKLDKDEEIDLENLESLKLGKDKSKDKDKDKDKDKEKEKEKDEEEEKLKSSEKKQSEEEDKKIEDSSNKKKILNDEEEDLKELKNSSNKKDEKDYEEFGKEDLDVERLGDSNNLKESVESSKKKSNEIPNLLDIDQNSGKKKNKNQFEDIRISDQDPSDLGINYTDQHQAYSVPQTQQKLHLPNASEENELENDNDNDNDNDFDYNYNLDKKSKKEDSNITNSNINSTHKKDKKKDEDSKSGQQSSAKNKNKNTSSKKKIQSSEKKLSNEKPKKEEDEKDKEDIDKNNAEQPDGEGMQGGGNEEKNEGGENQNNVEQKNSQTNEEENEETPYFDEGMKYEIMKEFKRIYGDKLDNLFLKQNLENSRSTFELALRNIKLAKQKMMKIGNRIPEADDLKTKEYLQRYEREKQMMEIDYNRQQKKLNFFEQRAINNFKQNIKDTRKAKEIEARKTEYEIERRRKAQEVRNHHNQVKFCNDIYQRALQLEKEKNLEKMKRKKEINRKENEEKRLAMERIENYYKDQIRLLKEILEKEKKQAEIQHRAQIQFWSKLEKERKNDYKKKLDDIFDRFDQEEKKNEFERRNRKDLALIFDSYYGNK